MALAMSAEAAQGSSQGAAPEEGAPSSSVSAPHSIEDPVDAPDETAPPSKVGTAQNTACQTASPSDRVLSEGKPSLMYHAATMECNLSNLCSDRASEISSRGCRTV